MNQYEIKFLPWDGLWCLSGPVGANGRLLFQSAREAAGHARWDAKTEGGGINVYDDEGKLFKTIEVEAEISDGEAYVLPSV
ncbi:MAG: hypothetical protein ACI9NQ_001999 [Paracoccaceae bacterium]